MDKDITIQIPQAQKIVEQNKIKRNNQRDSDYANYAIYKLCLTRWLQDRIDTFLYILLKANAML